MTHAHKNAATNEEPKPSLVPRLRFPEFEGAGVRSVRLGDVTEEVRSRNGNKLAIDSVMGVTKADGIVPMEARLIAADIARYKLVQKDCFAYNPMRLNIGSIARWKGECEILVSPDYVVFNCINDDESGIAPGFLDQFRQTRAWEEFVTEGGDGSVRVRIYFKDIARLGLALPSLPEQQRIASCLSSLDELITAQARKVDALKTHKKGLMQQLFPREGETQPRLRFPEFEGEWEERRLGDVATFHKGKGISKADISTNGRTPCIRYGELYTVYGEIVEYVQSRTDIPVADLFLSQSNDVIIPASGETRLDIAKAACVIHDDVALGGDLNVIRTSHRGVFLSYYLNGPKRYDIAKVAQGDTVAHLYPSQLKKLVVSLPSEAEQQRIASCLSSLDELITNENNKLETYKTHKKGLMQGLFPKVGESTT